MKMKSPGDDPPPPIKVKAWIDSRALLPVALDSKIALCVFISRQALCARICGVITSKGFA